MRDYHAEYAGIYECLFEHLNHPVLLVYATPAPYGEKLFKEIMHIMSQIETRSKSTVETIPIDGTHHFHMLKPIETSELLIRFFDKVNLNFKKSYLKFFQIKIQTLSSPFRLNQKMTTIYRAQKRLSQINRSIFIFVPKSHSF